MDPVRYVIARRLGDFDEYMQEDGNFGPLTDHQRFRDSRPRRDVTRVFLEEVQAKAVVKAYENKHPTVSLFVKLEIKRIP
jgi:hypothetical protein